MANRPQWMLEAAPPLSAPRGKVRRLLTAAAIAVGSVCGIGPLAACNYKGCRYDDGYCYDRPDDGVPDLGATDMAVPAKDLSRDAGGDGGGGHD